MQRGESSVIPLGVANLDPARWIIRESAWPAFARHKISYTNSPTWRRPH